MQVYEELSPGVEEVELPGDSDESVVPPYVLVVVSPGVVVDDVLGDSDEAVKSELDVETPYVLVSDMVEEISEALDEED